MNYPPFVNYKTEAEYREHYEKVYCCVPIITFDGITVRFRKSRFDHAFFESSRRDGNKNKFSPFRAERIDWIKAALEDPDGELYEGWDKKSHRHTRNRRVAIVKGNYIVIINLISEKTADFNTAFVDRGVRTPGRPRTIDQIRSAPKWVQKNR